MTKENLLQAESKRWCLGCVSDLNYTPSLFNTIPRAGEDLRGGSLELLLLITGGFVPTGKSGWSTGFMCDLS